MVSNTVIFEICDISPSTHCLGFSLPDLMERHQATYLGYEFQSNLACSCFQVKGGGKRLDKLVRSTR